MLEWLWELESCKKGEGWMRGESGEEMKSYYGREEIGDEIERDDEKDLKRGE